MSSLANYSSYQYSDTQLTNTRYTQLQATSTIHLATRFTIATPATMQCYPFYHPYYTHSTSTIQACLPVATTQATIATHSPSSYISVYQLGLLRVPLLLSTSQVTSTSQATSTAQSTSATHSTRTQLRLPVLLSLYTSATHSTRTQLRLPVLLMHSTSTTNYSYHHYFGYQ